MRTFERNGANITENKWMNGNRLTVELTYEAGGKDVFEWQLWTPGEIAAETGRFGLRFIAACSAFDESKAVAAEQPRMQIVFEMTREFSKI